MRSLRNYETLKKGRVWQGEKGTKTKKGAEVERGLDR